MPKTIAERELLAVERGWLIEEDAVGFCHWIALEMDSWPRRDVRLARNKSFEREEYRTPVRRVKDASEALRFARREDAEAFIKLFDRFLLAAKATEHEWPAAFEQSLRPPPAADVLTCPRATRLHGPLRYCPDCPEGDACELLLDEDLAPAGDAETLAQIAAMMDRHVTNWPAPKKVKTALALIDKTLAAALTPTPAQDVEPIPMLLYCPKCGLQHIDEPDERTPNWTNPPHKSHLCHGCGCIWRPADVPTEGVLATATVGKADTWEPNERALSAQDVEKLVEALLTKRDYIADAASGALTYEDSGEGFKAMAAEDLARIDALIAAHRNTGEG